MGTKRKKHIDNPLTATKFPMIFEHGKPTAFIVDIQKYREFELLVDNLIHLRQEDEDTVLEASETLEKLVARARKQAGESDGTTKWEDELDAL